MSFSSNAVDRCAGTDRGPPRNSSPSDWPKRCAGASTSSRHQASCPRPFRIPRSAADPVTESSGTLGKAVLYVRCEFQGGEGAVRFDEVVGSAGQAGQYVVDHGCVGAGGGQVDGPLSLGGGLGLGA